MTDSRTGLDTGAGAGPEPVVTKKAAEAAQAVRIRREAELLAHARLPGVVELVALEGGADDPVLVTARVEGTDLSRLSPLSVEEAAGVVAAVGAVVADLHDLGVVHGSLGPDHVVVRPDGRPVLCGFGYGGRLGEERPGGLTDPEPATEVAGVPGEPLTPAVDVFALGTMLRHLVDEAVAAPRVRGGRRRSAPRVEAEGLRAVAGRATVPEPELRPSARAVSAAVRDAVPAATLPRRCRGPDVDDAPGAAWPGVPRAGALGAWRPRAPRASELIPPRRRWRLVALSVTVLTLVATASVLRPGDRRHRITAPPPVSLAPPPTSTAPAMPGSDSTEPTAPATLGSPPPTVVGPTSSCPLVSSLLAADTDGDGCPEALQWADGVVSAGDRRWAVGQPGDVAVTGDWACRGQATLALLRPATGQVFVFGGWPPPGQELAAPLAAEVAGGFALRPADLDADGCPDLTVERGEGPPVPVHLPGRP